MFTITVKHVIDPDSLDLLERVVDLLENRQQARIDRLAKAVHDVTARLRASETALNGAIKL